MNPRPQVNSSARSILMMLCYGCASRARGKQVARTADFAVRVFFVAIIATVR